MQRRADRRGLRPPVIWQILHNLDVGGAEILAARIARRLSDRFRIGFVCLESHGRLAAGLEADGFPVRALDKRGGVDWSAARRLRRLLKAERVDLIHAHQYGPHLYAGLSRLPVGGPPILLTEHGRAFPDPVRRLHRTVNRFLLRHDDRLFGVGEGVRRALIEVEGFPADRVGVIFNGIDLNPYATCTRDRAAVREELGLRADDFVLIQVARLDPIKDHPTALRVLQRLLARRDDIRLVLVGDGPASGSIRALVRDQGLEPYVRLLGRRRDVPRLIGAADLTILTSLSEGVPLSLIEAMAAGLPVVATCVGGVSEVVVEGLTGRLAPAGNDVTLADRIFELSADPAQRDRLGRAGRERAYASFSEDRMVAEYDCVYHEMAGRVGLVRA